MLPVGVSGVARPRRTEAVPRLPWSCSNHCRRCLRGAGSVRSGERVVPTKLPFPVTVGRCWLKRDGKQEVRVVVATFCTSGRTVSRWGRHRWRIAGFFKTAKHRFGLARFAQGTARGMYRFLVLSLLAFVLSQWGAGSTPARV